jgi:hypothetical protein
LGEYFDRARWDDAITQPDWYVHLYPELEQFKQRWIADESAENLRLKEVVRGYFEAVYESGQLALAQCGADMDGERKPVDSIVIHHTSSQPGYDIRRMNITQLLNVYLPYYVRLAGKSGTEQAPGIWSGHIRGGKQVFYAYHQFLRMDGSFEPLLKEEELGWHAANWEVNCSSVGICLDNDYERSDPDPSLIRKLGEFIADVYPQVPKSRIFGHGEVAQHPTVCPGNNFAGGWKQQLIASV